MRGTADRTRPSWLQLVEAATVAGALLVFLAYGVRVAALCRYPWDWSPDEGLALDAARRVLHAPATLYGASAVPFPWPYTPLLPLILAPVVALSDNPLLFARLLALAWTALLCGAAFVLVRARAGVPLALASSALSLAPFDLTFWHVLVRVDSLALALWLAAAVPLLPRRLGGGGDRLSWRRVVAGSALLLAAVLAKPTALVMGAPLVLGWFLVDRASAVRLLATLGAAGLLVVVLLQDATGGAFLWVMGFWRWHATFAAQALPLLVFFVARITPILATAAVGCFFAAALGLRPWRDPALLLALGAALLIPGLAKHGAWWNYLLPLLATTGILAGRWWGVAGEATARSALPALGGLALGAVAVVLAATRVFPLPDPADEATARTFYTFARAQGTPLLALRPDYAYVLVGQPVEVEATSLVHLARAHAPGLESVRVRLQEHAYPLLIEGRWPLPAEGGLAAARDGSYRPVGTCILRYYYGAERFRFLLPKGSAVHFEPPVWTLCRPIP
jgi:hypothetical protein